MSLHSALGTQHQALPLIAIIGRPNVGKSTLFNRILGTRAAIVDDIPGVTRDRHYADGSYLGRAFRLVDTGGLDPAASEGMLALVKQQTQIAIAEADVLIMLVDGRSGLTPADEELVALLRKVRKPLFVAVNKIDTPKVEPLLADFYRLGRDRIFPISAEHGLGVDDLLEAIRLLLPEAPAEPEAAEPPRIAVVGRPNVGKSTMINALAGEARVLVSDVPGTTRDAIDTLVTYRNRPYLFTDTAGIRRRGKVERGIEGYSVLRAMKAMGRSDVAVLLLDAVEGITEQDTKIAGLALRQGRACLVLVNKWDLQRDNPEAREKFELDLRRKMAFLSWAPVLYGSALKADVLTHFFTALDRVIKAYTTRVSTGPLNQFLQRVVETHPLPVRKGKPTKTVRSVFMTQVATKPPAFALFVGHPENVTPTYLRFLENQLREEFDFQGTPIRLMVRKK
jgi:GTP-binding protein